MPENLLRLRSARGQIEALCRSIKALEGHAPPALEYANGLLADASTWRERYPHLAVVLNPNVYHDLDAVVALEAWQRHSHLNAHIDIACMRSGFSNYNPRQFQLSERTEQVLTELGKKQQARFLVIPTRIERIDPQTLSERTLADGEFDFNLSATLWVLASHAQRWEPPVRDTVQFAALGECFVATKAASTVPVAGFKGGVRHIATKHAEELRHFHVLTGLVR